ncbi:MAG TPA: NCS2 family permease [Methylomirabilota bacterium]|jgi:AGZA family xanthine/uracil permease-like MFS transporter|nr:NCS2 family permease [Methylomirabilota bacterium]
MLEGYFRLKEHGTTVGAEVLAGLTTFMVMAYIIFVNPAILSFAGIPALQPQGVPFAPTLAATCLVAALATAAMGLVTNYPLAVASGMGLNAVVAFQLIAAQKLPWPAAMGVIFLEGVVITLLVMVGVREAVLNAIPLALKRAISVGIGLFILFIGLVNGGVVRPGQGIPVTLGALTTPKVLVAVAGLLLTLIFLARGVRAALLLGILGTTVLAIVVNALHGGSVWTLPGVAVLPASLVAWPDFSTLGAGVNVEVFGRLGILAACLAIFSIMLSDFFDTVGTVVGIGAEARWLDREGRLPRMNRVLLVDSLAAALGGAASASSATTYIESAAGVAAGGRTGLTSVVVALCFGLALFAAPLAGVVPPEATAPALIVVGFLMCALVREIPFGDLEEGFPALLTMTLMPFSYSITNGIGAGFVSYVVIKLVRGRAAAVHPLLYAAAAAFVVYFALH